MISKKTVLSPCFFNLLERNIFGACKLVHFEAHRAFWSSARRVAPYSSEPDPLSRNGQRKDNENWINEEGNSGEASRGEFSRTERFRTRRPWESRGSAKSRFSSKLNLPEVYWPGGKKGCSWGFDWGNSDYISLQAQRDHFRRQRRIEKALVAKEMEPSFERFLEAKKGGEKWIQNKIRWLAETLPHVQVNSAVKILNAQRPWITVQHVVSLIHLLAEMKDDKVAVRVYKWVRVMPFYKHNDELLQFVRTLTTERIT